MHSLFSITGNSTLLVWKCSRISARVLPGRSSSGEFPCTFPVEQGIAPETSSLQSPPTATESARAETSWSKREMIRKNPRFRWVLGVARCASGPQTEGSGNHSRRGALNASHSGRVCAHISRSMDPAWVDWDCVARGCSPFGGECHRRGCPRSVGRSAPPRPPRRPARLPAPPQLRLPTLGAT